VIWMAIASSKPAYALRLTLMLLRRAEALRYL
jgi:hypothetical protein